MLKKLLFATLLLSSTTHAMHEFELNVNNKDLDLHLGLDMGQFNDSIEPDSFIIKARLMKGDIEHARLPYKENTNIEQDTNILGEIGFMAQSSSAMAPGLTMGMGVKLAYTPLDKQSIFAMPIGVMTDYTLPFDIIIPLFLPSLETYRLLFSIPYIIFLLFFHPSLGKILYLLSISEQSPLCLSNN